jgi:hypothetical protein
MTSLKRRPNFTCYNRARAAGRFDIFYKSSNSKGSVGNQTEVGNEEKDAKINGTTTLRQISRIL